MGEQGRAHARPQPRRAVGVEPRKKFEPHLRRPEAAQVLGNDAFRYVRELVDGDEAMLEFVTELDGISVNGVDIIHFNADGEISDFKVMVRPLKAINAVWQMMGAQLSAAKG